jgi:hypothetical protein
MVGLDQPYLDQLLDNIQRQPRKYQLEVIKGLLLDELETAVDDNDEIRAMIVKDELDKTVEDLQKCSIHSLND